jgi:hypothetical protein
VAAQLGRSISVLHPVELLDASIRGLEARQVAAGGRYFRAAR